MSRVYNFSAGPATLPEEVLAEAAKEMLDYGGTGMSVMEMSHRSAAFGEILGAAEADLRALMRIPPNYKVLFLQGGASLQFSMIPLNLMKNRTADYVLTGQWAKKAYLEAKKYGDAAVAASSEDGNFSYIPDCQDLPIRAQADYVYICENNTIYGTKFRQLPDTKGKPLVSDVSSIAIIREDLITGEPLPGTPTMLSYQTHAEHGSMYNTPNCYCIYICGKVFRWIQKMGGLDAMRARNEEKAAILYDFLEESRLFRPTAAKADRSLMNVPFVTGDADLDAAFAKEAQAAGLVNLKGHRSVGGMRASIYNAMPIAGVKALVAFMKKFEEANA